MINNPEIQNYIQEKLQEQAEQIAERIILRYADSMFSPEYADMEYFTGLPREKIEAIVEKCRWKVLFRNGFSEGVLLHQVSALRDAFLYKEALPETIAKNYHLTEQQMEDWSKTPNRCAVLELVAHGIDDSYTAEALGLPIEEVVRLNPNYGELGGYKNIFPRTKISDEELEEKYQKMMKREGKVR